MWVSADNTRTIISAMNPRRNADSFTEIWLTVWFEQIDVPIEVIASPFYPGRHGRELWIRAMAGEYGEIEIAELDMPILPAPGAWPSKLIDVTPQRMLTRHGN